MRVGMTMDIKMAMGAEYGVRYLDGPDDKHRGGYAYEHDFFSGALDMRMGWLWGWACGLFRGWTWKRGNMNGAELGFGVGLIMGMWWLSGCFRIGHYFEILSENFWEHY